MNKALRVLIVEDSVDDAEFVIRELRRNGLDPTHERVDTSEQMEAALQRQSWDIVVSDYAMPGFNGFDALKLLRSKDPDLPFILMSGVIGEDTAVAAMKAGAQDCLIKGNFARLAPAIERELLESAIRRERNNTAWLLQAIVNSSNDPIISKSLNGIVTSWNRSAERVFGFSAAEMIGQPILRIIPPDQFEQEKKILEELGTDARVQNLETVRLAKDGLGIPVSLTISPIQDHTGAVVGASNIMRDITQRKKAEAELAAWQRELESRVQSRTTELRLAHEQLQGAVEKHRQMEAEVARAIEREQLRLGQELHDSLGQQLTGINYMLMALQTRWAEASPVAAQEMVKIQSLFLRLIEQTRTLAQGFYPVELEKLGLLVALQEITPQILQSSKIAYRVESDGNAVPADFNGPLAIQIFRVAQEAVHNVAKHSGAKQVIIRLTATEGNTVMMVKDDGKGFPPNVDRSKGMGLRIMQYRVETAGGKLSVHNDPNGGAVVTCSIPFAGRTPPAREGKSSRPLRNRKVSKTGLG